jgi:hypothetical protein
MNETEFRTLVLGTTGQPRTELHNGREHLVVPVVALLEGVIHAVNAQTPELVPLSTLQKAAESFNGRPVTLGHPRKNGVQCSAQDPTAAASHIGTIRNSRIVGKKMLCEALIEKSRAKQLDAEMYLALMNGEPQEVSIGASVVTDRTPGTFNGKPYMASWTFADGDHLAFLPDSRGACSVEMGCGTHRAAQLVTLEGKRHSSADQLHLDEAHRHVTSALGHLSGAGARHPGVGTQDEADFEQEEKRAAENFAPPDSYGKALAERRAAERKPLTEAQGFENSWKVTRAAQFAETRAALDAPPLRMTEERKNTTTYPPLDPYKAALEKRRQEERQKS